MSELIVVEKLFYNDEHFKYENNVYSYHFWG